MANERKASQYEAPVWKEHEAEPQELLNTGAAGSHRDDADREPKEFTAEMVDEACRAYGDHDIRHDTLAISKDTMDDGLDTIIAEERVACVNPNEKWWRQ